MKEPGLMGPREIVSETLCRAKNFFMSETLEGDVAAVLEAAEFIPPDLISREKLGSCLGCLTEREKALYTLCCIYQTMLCKRLLPLGYYREEEKVFEILEERLSQAKDQLLRGVSEFTKAKNFIGTPALNRDFCVYALCSSKVLVLGGNLV